MNAATRRAEYKRQLRAEILDAARELFVRDGYESFSMRRLAVRVDYSPASLYLHFKNKQELFGCLVENSFTALMDALAALRAGEDQDPVTTLKKGLRTYVDFGLRNRNQYRFAFLLQPALRTRPYKPHAAFRTLRQMVGRCIKAKRFRNRDVEAMSQALWAAVHGVTSLLIQRPTFPWVARQKLIEQVINSAVGGLLVQRRES